MKKKDIIKLINQEIEKDSFQSKDDLFNNVLNELSKQKIKLSIEERKALRALISKVSYALYNSQDAAISMRPLPVKLPEDDGDL